jgi:hypothetical protein
VVVKSVPQLITIVVREGRDFDVHAGEGYANRLCFDEMLATVVDLTHTAPVWGIARYFHTPEQRDAEDARRAASIKAREERAARIAAERAALPTLELRALHCFVELYADRDLHSSDEPLPLDQQPDPDIQEAMRRLAAATQPTPEGTP